MSSDICEGNQHALSLIIFLGFQQQTLSMSCDLPFKENGQISFQLDMSSLLGRKIISKRFEYRKEFSLVLHENNANHIFL